MPGIEDRRPRPKREKFGDNASILANYDAPG